MSLSDTQATGQAEPIWPMIHGDSQLTGQSDYDTSKIGGAIKWRFKTGEPVSSVEWGGQSCF